MSPDLCEIAAAAAAGRLHDPFAVLGPHWRDGAVRIAAFLPGALRAEAISHEDGCCLASLEPVDHGLFAGRIDGERRPYVLRIAWPDGIQETEDPYSFSLLLSDDDLHLFSEGSHWGLARRFGAQLADIEGVSGVVFSVWAPNARRVSVIGDFNAWDGRRHPMRLRPEAGVWELFIPRLGPGARYKYEIVGADGTLLPAKADPIARQTERPPQTASIVAKPLRHVWRDQRWMEERGARHAPEAPISIYEAHAASWLRPANDPDGVLDWDELVRRLIPYAADLGFTHIELLPITEHPFGGSWGYQTLGLFAPSARFGEPDGFARFVDAAHRAGVGVILDWAPAHFPSDAHGLARFDGAALYEHDDPREGVHQDWNTLIYNFGRREVQGMLIASALYWLETFHIDGLRVDAVASMLYRDYSRQPGQWIANKFGGRENLEAIEFLKRLNAVIKARSPGAMTIAEESTAWAGVTAPLSKGGLGFDYKWNMGWMHDTLGYVARDPVHRAYHHNDMTFGTTYAHSERFVLPLSHDEVVHGKGSLIGKMPGDDWRRRANLRVYLAFQWAHPGKKLLFMGGEFGQEREWSHDRELDWDLLRDDAHSSLQRLVADLNGVYRREPALHRGDCDPLGFEWLVGDDRANSVFAWLRHDPASARAVLCVFNFTPTPRHEYRIGVPRGGRWAEICNTDAAAYGGAAFGNLGGVDADNRPSHGQAHAVSLTLPPLAALFLRPEAAA